MNLLEIIHSKVHEHYSFVLKYKMNCSYRPIAGLLMFVMLSTLGLILLDCFCWHPEIYLQKPIFQKIGIFIFFVLLVFISWLLYSLTFYGVFPERYLKINKKILDLI